MYKIYIIVRNILTILFTILFVVSSNSQNIRSIQIINSKTKQGIPYATIKSKLVKKSISSDKNGIADIQILESDSILVSSIGYFDLVFASTKMKSNTVFELQEYYQTLEEVTVGKLMNIEIKQNNFKESFSLTPNPKNQWCIATKFNIPNGISKIRLNSIKVFIRKTEHKKTNPLRLHIYKADNNGLLIEQELLHKDVVIPEMEINRKFIEFKIEDQNIIINKTIDSIFYIGIEFMNFLGKETYDSPGIKITKNSTEQNTVFKDFFVDPEIISKWVYISDKNISTYKSSKATHPWNMIVTISTSVIN